MESTTGEVDGGGLLGPVVCGQIQLATLRGKFGDGGEGAPRGPFYCGLFWTFFFLLWTFHFRGGSNTSGYS